MPLFNARSEVAEQVRHQRRLWLQTFEKLGIIQTNMATIRQAINLNESGDFQAGDLALFDTVATEMIAAARTFSDGLPGGP